MVKEKDEKAVGQELGEDGTEPSLGIPEDWASAQLVKAVVDPTEAQLPSMTNLQANVVLPLTMMETFEELIKVMGDDLERYAAWMKRHAKFMGSPESKKKIKVLREAEEILEKRPWWKGGGKKVVRKGEPKEEKVEITVWGPKQTDEERKREAEVEEQRSALLLRVFRLSLYKHRRSVDGLQRMATVDLAKERMSTEAEETTETVPDFED